MVGLGKHCTECQRWYPLFMFKKDIRKFQLKIALGKVRRCKICCHRESGRGKVVRWTGDDFKLVQLTFKQRIKELLG